MEESVSWKSFAIYLDQLLALFSVPGNLIGVDAAPARDTFAIVTHGVESPKIKQLLRLRMVIDGFHIIRRAIDIGWTFLGKTDI